MIQHCMHRLFRRLAALLALSTLAGAAFAEPVRYRVQIDTSTLAGLAWLDLQFNPASADSPTALAELSQFSGALDGTQAAVATGAVSGSLPADLVFDNSSAFNDFFQPVFLGGVFSFSLTLDAPGLSADGFGSVFAVSLYADDQMTPLGAADPFTGSLLTFELSDTVTPTVFDVARVSVSVVPEPSALALAVMALVVLSGAGLRRGSRAARGQSALAPLALTTLS